MEKDLIVKRGELEEKSRDLESLLKMIRIDTTVAERKKSEVEVVRRRLTEEARELKAQVDHIEHELADAMPVLNDAVKALDAITASDISNLRTMRQPPVLIKRIMDAVLILMRRPMQPQSTLYAMQGKTFHPEITDIEPCWSEAKTMMATSGFLKSLTEFDPQLINAETIDLLEPYLGRPDFTFEAAKRSSGNIAGVCTWVRSLVRYYHIAKVVLPLKAAAELEAEKLERKKLSLKEAEDELIAKKEALEKITAEYDIAMRSMAELEHGLERTKNNIASARSLIKGLEGEKIRWAREHTKLEARLNRIPCECTIAAAFLIYAGPLSQHLRKVMFNKWPTIVAWGEVSGIMQVQSSERADQVGESTRGDTLDPIGKAIMEVIKSLLVPPNLEDRWILQGLPADQHSLENAIIVMNSVPGTRIPLLLDSQLQGSSWLNHALLSSDPSRVMLPQDDKRLPELLEDAMARGSNMIVTDIQPGSLPLVLRSLIARKIVAISKSTNDNNDDFIEEIDSDTHEMTTSTYDKSSLIMIGDEEWKCASSFRLFLVQNTSSLNGFTNEILGGLTVIDFSVTPLGLEDQLLEVVASLELRDLQRQRRTLSEDLGKDRERLSRLGETLLSALSSARGNLLEDGDLINVLKETNDTVETTAAKIKSTEQTQQQLQHARENYRSVARLGSTIFFAINELKSQNHVYQVSLARFLEYYQLAMRHADPTEDVNRRILLLKEVITKVVCSSVNSMLYEKDRLTFGLLLSLRLLRNQGLISTKHFHAVVSPVNDSLGHAMSPVPQASADWLSQREWVSLKSYESVFPEFEVVADQLHVERHARKWKAWKLNVEPERITLPLPMNDAGLFVLVRIWRPDRVVAMSEIIVERELKLNSGESSMNAGVMTASEMTKQYGSAKRPTIYLLSQGADPAADIADLAHRERIEFHQFAMGQGQEAKALSKLIQCAYEGTWLMLQNCHLNCDFMTSLDRLFDSGKDASKTSVLPKKEKDIKTDNSRNTATRKARFLTKRQGGNSSLSGSNRSTGNTNEDLNNRSVSSSSKNQSSLIIQSSFRLWLTILPTDLFPESLLKMSVVVSSEPPNGLRAGLLGCYAKGGPAAEFFHDVSHKQWHKFLFAICFLHISVYQRREYGQFGWSFPYAFGKADLSASLMYSRTLFDSSDSEQSIDWISVRFVVSEILYGGLITADSDRDVVSALGRSLLDGRIYTDGYHIAPGLRMPSSIRNTELNSVDDGRNQPTSNSHSLTSDGLGQISDYLAYAAEIPAMDNPSWYGLHVNAAFSSLKQRGIHLIRNIWECFPSNQLEMDVDESIVSSRHRTASHENRMSILVEERADDVGNGNISAICDRITKLSKSFDLLGEVPKMQSSDKLPFNFVLHQEHAALRHVYQVLNYNIKSVCQSTMDRGTSSNSTMYIKSELKSNGLPRHWCHLLPSCGAFAGISISSWIDRLQAIQDQIRAWILIEKKICKSSDHRELGTDSTTDGDDDYGKKRQKQVEGSSLTHRLNVYEMGLLFNPSGFLVALRQEVVRLKRKFKGATKSVWSIEETKFRTSVLNPKDTSSKTLNIAEEEFSVVNPDLGTNLRGITLEGAAWSGSSLVEQSPLEIIVSMPIIQLTVIHARSATFTGRTFKCPVYKCSGNRDPESKIFEVFLPSDIQSDHWILRGVAMSLSTQLSET